MILAICNRDFDGIHPSFRHTPPKLLFLSINVTLNPKSAARNAAVYPPGPAPITIKSQLLFCSSILKIIRVRNYF